MRLACQLADEADHFIQAFQLRSLLVEPLSYFIVQLAFREQGQGEEPDAPVAGHDESP